MLLGSHLSIAGGHVNALKTAVKLNLKAVAIFTASPRIWSRPDPNKLNFDEFLTYRYHNKFVHVIAHALYLANPASPSIDMKKKSIQAIVADLKICHQFQIPWLVIHPGSHQGKGESRGIRQAAHILDECLYTAQSSVTGIALETTSGSGHHLGGQFEHLRDIIGFSRFPERYSICLDTCHIFAAGYDFRTENSWNETRSKINNCLGLDTVRVLHLNDSIGELGSHKDRHTHIGKGNIGLDGFANIVNDVVLGTLPMILETPKDQHHSNDQRNIDILCKLRRDNPYARKKAHHIK